MLHGKQHRATLLCSRQNNKTRRQIIKDFNTLFIGLDVHKDTITVAVAEGADGKGGHLVFAGLRRMALTWGLPSTMRGK